MTSCSLIFLTILFSVIHLWVVFCHFSHFTPTKWVLLFILNDPNRNSYLHPVSEGSLLLLLSHFS